jgi:hypothetical protein
MRRVLKFKASELRRQAVLDERRAARYVKSTLTAKGRAMLDIVKRKLRCSFCGKAEKQVDRLIGSGSGRYICDGCVSVCNQILDATPSPFKGWDAMSDEQLLSAIKASEASVAALRSLQEAQIEALRKHDVSWAEIGKALGVSRQAAWERFS